jgi:hypothetical protein
MVPLRKKKKKRLAEQIPFSSSGKQQLPTEIGSKGDFEVPEDSSSNHPKAVFFS